MDSSHFLIQALLADGVITKADVDRAAHHAQANSCAVTDALISLNIVGSRALAILRAKICEYPFVDLNAFDIDLRNAERLPRAVAERLGVFPLFCLDDIATVAMLDPFNLQALDQVRQILKTEVDPALCDSTQLTALIARAYTMVTAGAGDPAQGGEAERDLTTGDEPVVAAVNQILATGADAAASDIHVSPDESALHLRYRVDGVLHPQQGPAKTMHAGIVQRLKVMARLDVTQTRKPQDGKFRFVHRGEPLDVRLSLMPTIHGENVVMRILRAGTKIGTIADLGMEPDTARWYSEAIQSPHGMVLVTGPTGSGKTTTLYTALAALNTPDVNIMTIEDPVEIRLPMIRQIQANPEIGLTFATALRSILRQDPDVVLVGEIRDPETAKIAVQAAMTGHLVLSTLHTNDAIGAIPRLKDFGLPLFAINQGLLCVIAQRLVRRVCAECAGPAPLDQDVLLELGVDRAGAAGLRHGAGCARCSGTGYRGRLGVHELLRMTRRIQRLVEKDAPAAEILGAATIDGFVPLWRDGLSKALRGLTSLHELRQLRSTIDGESVAESLRVAA